MAELSRLRLPLRLGLLYSRCRHLVRPGGAPAPNSIPGFFLCYSDSYCHGRHLGRHLARLLVRSLRHLPRGVPHYSQSVAHRPCPAHSRHRLRRGGYQRLHCGAARKHPHHSQAHRAWPGSPRLHFSLRQWRPD